MDNKKSFLLYLDRLELLDDLGDEEAGVLFKAIVNYIKNGDIPPRGGIVSAAFQSLKSCLDSDTERYRLICQKRSEAGKKGGRPSKETAEEKSKKSNALSEEETEKQKNQMFNFAFSEKAKKADTDININNTSKYVSNSKYVSKYEEREDSIPIAGARTRKALPSYEDIIEAFGVTNLLKQEIFEFIKSCQAKGITFLNARLENLIIALDLKFQNEEDRIQYLRNAILEGRTALDIEE